MTDTQAPDTSREAVEQLCRTLCFTGSNYAAASEAPAALRALLAERDLAAAQTTAAAMQMREDALARIAPAARGWPDACTNAALAAATREIEALPLPGGQAALDRMLAEARREAFDEAAGIAEADCDWSAFGKSGVPEWDGGPDEVRDYRLGIATGRAIAAAIRARASKKEL